MTDGLDLPSRRASLMETGDVLRVVWPDGNEFVGLVTTRSPEPGGWSYGVLPDPEADATPPTR